MHTKHRHKSELWQWAKFDCVTTTLVTILASIFLSPLRLCSFHLFSPFTHSRLWHSPHSMCSVIWSGHYKGRQLCQYQHKALGIPSASTPHWLLIFITSRNVPDFSKYISHGLFPELSQSAPNLGLMVTVDLTPPPPRTACVLMLLSQEASFYPLNF